MCQTGDDFCRTVRLVVAVRVTARHDSFDALGGWPFRLCVGTSDLDDVDSRVVCCKLLVSSRLDPFPDLFDPLWRQVRRRLELGVGGTSSFDGFGPP
jgi:hypothetical protein